MRTAVHGSTEAYWKANMHPDDYPRFIEKWKDAFSKQETLCAEYRILDAVGDYRWIEILSISFCRTTRFCCRLQPAMFQKRLITLIVGTMPC
jgi:PAS fold.